MLEAGELIAVTYPGAAAKVFTTPDTMEQLIKIRISRQIRLLCPFDNLVIQRKRLQQVFDFDYQIECYVPEGKRKYGYYCLPILHGTDLVGRLDPKADRKTGVLEIRNLELEASTKTDEQFVLLMAEKLAALAAFNGCQTVNVAACNSKTFKNMLLHALAELSMCLRNS